MSSSSRQKARQTGRSSRNRMVGSAIASSGRGTKGTGRSGRSSAASASARSQSKRPTNAHVSNYDVITGEPMNYAIADGTEDPGQTFGSTNSFDKFGMTDNHNRPIDPLTGEELVDLGTYRSVLEKSQPYLQFYDANQAAKGGAAPAHLKASIRGYGSGYPGHVDGDKGDTVRNMNNYYGRQEPTMHRHARRNYDILSGNEFPPEPEPKPIPEEYQAAMRSQGLEPGKSLSETGSRKANASRPVSIVSWSSATNTKFGDDCWYEQSMLPGRSARGGTKTLTAKVGVEDGSGRKVHLQKKSAEIGGKVGGDRANDFIRTERARREEARGFELTNKPHHAYG